MSKLLMEAMEFGRPGKEESALEIMSANQPSNDKRWEYWLEDDWYTRVVYLKLHGKLRAEALERTASSVAMLDSEGSRVSADGWGQSLSVVDIPGAEWTVILVCLEG